jgi:hypothetical protein
MPLRYTIIIALVTTLLLLLVLFLVVGINDPEIGPKILLTLLVMAVSVHTFANAVIYRHRHRDLIQGHRLEWLRGSGFTVENLGDYWGYIGTYRGYLMRIYFDWSSSRTNQDHELCILVHYERPRRADGKSDIARIRRFQQDLVSPIFGRQDPLISDHHSFIIHHIAFTWFTKANRVKRAMDRAVDKLLEHKLAPLSEAQVIALIARSWENAPPISTFQEALTNAPQTGSHSSSH